MAEDKEKKALETSVLGQNSSEPSIHDGAISYDEAEREKHEVFKKTEGGVDFRTVTWQRATLIFLKIQISTGILGIPGALYSLGAVGGGLSIIGWQILNTWTAILMAEFRNRHPECHTLVDMCGKMWGPIGKEFVGVMFIIAYVFCTGSGILGTSIAFNALSEHGACSVVFSFVSTVMVIMVSSVRTWGKMTWPLTAGFVSVMAGVLTVTIGVTLRDRPAAAPQTGDFELGWYAIAYPTFAAGMTATATIFISSAGGPGYLPVIAEMKKPKDYKKAIILVSFIVAAVYLSVAEVIYRWCGVWVASPSLGSAGPLLKKVAFGLALPSLIISAALFNHTGAKYVFVRILRDSPHLQINSFVHWGTWLGVNIFLGVLAWVLAEAIPIFNYLIALAGAICFAPMSLIFPACLWMFDFGHYRTGKPGQIAFFYLHILIALVGALLLIGGTYGTALSIKEAYATGTIGGAFSCADNSGTVA
ncbi:putative Amino acid transporter transmembrane domain-containing protein [Seiridium unicorne]|uniref:Amino acid transporter transmembrane domain-containing protein n=1 Tax=Seiridium unicorne TaxID=138068 RepID=A0ABR2UVU1_9PEZI